MREICNLKKTKKKPIILNHIVQNKYQSHPPYWDKGLLELMSTPSLILN